MTTPFRLAAFAALLAVGFGGAALAGDAIGPEPRERTQDDAGGHAKADAAKPESEAGHGHAGPAAAAEKPADGVRGLAVAANGLRLVLETPEVRRGAAERLSFRIVGEDGRTVRDFEVEHEKRMHLIVARRDLTGFQHLHPTQRGDGSWRTDIRIPDAGSYRVFADFVRDGETFTLAGDLRVDGAAELRGLPEPAPLADAGDGYEVRLDNDPVRAGRDAELRFTVHKGGGAVHVEPYLGAGGHLVALREGDLAYLHVHPTGHGGEGDAHGDAHDDSIGFEATFPTEGRYRLFLQFKHEGRVRTAAFTLEVTR